MNKKCIESLIKAGAFDEFEQTRATLLSSFESIMDTIQSSKRKEMTGQVTLFDIGTEEEQEKMSKEKYMYFEQPELSEKEKLMIEKEMLGIYVSGHPLEDVREVIEKNTTINTMILKELDEQMNSNLNEEEVSRGMSGNQLRFKDGQVVKYAGIINSIKKKYTKNNRVMAFVTIEDLYGTAEVIVFESAYVKAGNSLMEGNLVMVEGRLSMREDETTTIIANNIMDFNDAISNKRPEKFENDFKRKELILDITDMDEDEKEKLRGAIKYFGGERNNVRIFVKVSDEKKPCGAIYFNDEVEKIFERIAHGRLHIE